MNNTSECTHGELPLASPRKGLRMQVLTSYEALENGNMKITTVTRTYQRKDSDFIDSQSTQIIIGAST